MDLRGLFERNKERQLILEFLGNTGAETYRILEVQDDFIEVSLHTDPHKVPSYTTFIPFTAVKTFRFGGGQIT